MAATLGCPFVTLGVSKYTTSLQSLEEKATTAGTRVHRATRHYAVAGIDAVICVECVQTECRKRFIAQVHNNSADSRMDFLLQRCGPTRRHEYGVNFHKGRNIIQ